MATDATGQVVARTPREPWLGSFLCGLMGWTLDGFDFFLVVFTLTAIGRTFAKDDKTVVLAMTATLALRPAGAFIFGLIADRYGRRIPFTLNLFLFAVVEVFTGFSHSFLQFLIVRAVFGTVMGDQWGIGVTLAMEKVPQHLRGVFSGLLQEGYAIGYLLAAGAYFSSSIAFPGGLCFFWERSRHWPLPYLSLCMYVNRPCGRAPGKPAGAAWAVCSRITGSCCCTSPFS
jgi:MFS family permease